MLLIIKIKIKIKKIKKFTIKFLTGKKKISCNTPLPLRSPYIISRNQFLYNNYSIMVGFRVHDHVIFRGAGERN